MRALMQRDPLVLSSLLERAVTYYPQARIATKAPDGIEHETYEELGARSARLANALKELGVGPGDRVGSFAVARAC